MASNQPETQGSSIPEHVGNYRVVRELGRGSMGTVYLAYQESLGRDVALKVLAPEFTRDEEFLERFKREGRIAARLRHPNIVQVFDASNRDGYYYIAMEYLGSLTLKQLLASHGGRLPQLQALQIADQLLCALAHAHDEGVVHRDVKPANILITDRGHTALTDFSIAQLQAAARLTRTGMMMGTPEYMAPEQFEGKNIDGRADLYAVGLILYEMLTGVQPFRGETTPEVMKAHFFREPEDPAALNPDIPPALAALIMKALEKQAAQRQQNADEMLAALRESGPDRQPESSLDQFLAAVTTGRVSLDDANLAREKVKEAIDRGYRKTLSVLMLDLVGSSKAKRPDETLHADRAFRDYRATINSALRGHSCTSFEWSGDGAICIFEMALQAVAASLEIQSLLDQVAERHPTLPERLQARIGINTGEVYLDPRRGLGEFASRTVDHAGHLEKDCPPGSIRVSQSTMELTQDAVEYQEIGLNRDGILVYEALANQLQTPAPAAVPLTVPRFWPGYDAPAGEGFFPGRYDMVGPAVSPATAPLPSSPSDQGVAAPWRGAEMMPELQAGWEEPAPAHPEPAAPARAQTPPARPVKWVMGLVALVLVLLVLPRALGPRTTPAPKTPEPVATPAPVALATPKPATPSPTPEPAPTPELAAAPSPLPPALSVSVTTSPSQAQAMVVLAREGHRYQGKGSGTVSVNLNYPGPYNLTVTAAGYRPYKKSIQVVGQQRLAVVLARLHQPSIEPPVASAPAPAHPAYRPPAAPPGKPASHSGPHQIQGPSL